MAPSSKAQALCVMEYRIMYVEVWIYVMYSTYQNLKDTNGVVLTYFVLEEVLHISGTKGYGLHISGTKGYGFMQYRTKKIHCLF